MLEVRASSQKDFFRVTENVYPKNTLYISPLKTDLSRFLSQKNPLFSQFGKGEFFVAYRNSTPVGRIVAHIHQKSNELHQVKYGFFGYFDCEENIDTAKALLQAAENWCRDQGMQEIRGNFNLTAMQQVGVQVDGFENIPYTDQVYSPPHIADYLTKLGYEDFFPMTTFELDLDSFDPDSLLKPKVEKALQNPQYEFRNLVKKNFLKQMNDVRKVLNDGFQNNPMFVAVTEEEFLFQAKDMMWIIDEDISFMAYEKGEPIGVVVCIPDLNPFLKASKSKFQLTTIFHYLKHKLKNDRAVIIFYSVAQEKHGQGINPALLYKTLKALKAKSYKKLGLTWIAEQNTASIRQTEKMGAKAYHRLKLFRKVL